MQGAAVNGESEMGGEVAGAVKRRPTRGLAAAPALLLCQRLSFDVADEGTLSKSAKAFLVWHSAHDDLRQSFFPPIALR